MMSNPKDKDYMKELEEILKGLPNNSGNNTDVDTNNSNIFSDLYPTKGEHEDPFAIDYGLEFYAYLTPIIVIVGLFGNTVSLCIFKRRALRKLSASVYLSAICVSDTCVLLFILLEWLNKGMHRIGRRGLRVSIYLHDGLCQSFLFFSYTFRIISVWLIIIFTFERYIAICWPFHRRLICTRSFSYKLIGCVSLIASILCLYKPIISDVSDVGGNIVCSRNEAYVDLNFILDSTYGVLITALPFVIITLLNLFILKKLVCHGSEQKDLKIVSTKDSKMRLEFTFILLSISTCFVCLNLPYFIIWCQRFSTQNEATSANGNSTSEASLTLFFNAKRRGQPRNELWLTRTIFFINYAINFFLYCLTGKQYRKYMRQLLCCKGSDRIDRHGSSFRSGYTSQSFVFNNSQKSSNGSQKCNNSSLKSSSSMASGGRMNRHGSSSCNRLVYSSSGSSISARKASHSTKV